MFVSERERKKEGEREIARERERAERKRESFIPMLSAYLPGGMSFLLACKYFLRRLKMMFFKCVASLLVNLSLTRSLIQSIIFYGFVGHARFN